MNAKYEELKREILKRVEKQARENLVNLNDESIDDDEIKMIVDGTEILLEDNKEDLLDLFVHLIIENIKNIRNDAIGELIGELLSDVIEEVMGDDDDE